MIRPSNKPRAELQQLANIAVADNGGPTCARVFFKYDCAGCDRRVTVAEPDILPRRARCLICGAWTTIERGGFLLQSRASAAIPWSGDVQLYFSKAYRDPRDATASVEFER